MSLIDAVRDAAVSFLDHVGDDEELAVDALAAALVDLGIVDRRRTGAPLRRCDRCAALFLRRSGAVFCSFRCKNAAQQKRFRERRRA